MMQTSSKNSTAIKQQTGTESTECKTCGAPASYSYFGAISCHSCKMFFKRNAERRQKPLKCMFDNHCEINILNRHVCASCRLTKCFTNGMQIELIRSSQSKKHKNNRTRKLLKKSIDIISTSLNRSNKNEQFPTLNILRSDQSILNIDQWNLLSNLVHCYDEYRAVLLAEHFVCEQNILPLKLRFKYSSVCEFIISLIRESRFLDEKNPDFMSLSSHDRSILLHSSTKYITILSASFTGRQTHLLDYPSLLQSTEILIGSTAMTLIKRLFDQLDFDIIFIKLILSILSFSTTNYSIYTNTDPINLINIKMIIHTHDKYIELAWRYLLCKYNYHQAVIYFSKLINCLFTLNAILVKVHEEKSFTDIINSIVDQTKRTLAHNN